MIEDCRRPEDDESFNCGRPNKNDEQVSADRKRKGRKAKCVVVLRVEIGVGVIGIVVRKTASTMI